MIVAKILTIALMLRALMEQLVSTASEASVVVAHLERLDYCAI